jgi:S1-C subfamily serine protease
LVLLASALIVTGLCGPRAGVAGSVENVVRDTLPSIVQIWFGDLREQAPKQARVRGCERQPRGSGTGFVIRSDPSGVYIMTNWHVADGCPMDWPNLPLRVEFRGGTTQPGSLVGSDYPTDLAIVKVSDLPSTSRPLAFADPETVHVGMEVVAIGYTFAQEGEPTVTRGIVSAIDRAPPDVTPSGLLQTDATINHGNSGGPLFDLRGNVIGVNESGYGEPVPVADVDGNNIGMTMSAAPGINFAIPSKIAARVAHDLMTRGHVLRASLGVGVTSVTRRDALESSEGPQPFAEGARVEEVAPGSPAAAAGIGECDVIEQLGDVRIRKAADLHLALMWLSPGSQVSLRYRHYPPGKCGPPEKKVFEMSPDTEKLLTEMGVANPNPSLGPNLAALSEGESRTVTVTLGG